MAVLLELAHIVIMAFVHAAPSSSGDRRQDQRPGGQMSGNDSSPSSASDPKWWVNGAWRDATPDILTPGSSPYTFAINADEFPDLAQAIVLADDVSGYLRAIGVSENSIVDHATTIAR